MWLNFLKGGTLWYITRGRERSIDLPHLYNIIIVEQPEAVALHNGDVVASVGATPTVDHHSYQVIHPVRVLSIVRLRE